MHMLILICQRELPRYSHQLQVEYLDSIWMFQLNCNDLRVQFWNHQLIAQRNLVFYELFYWLVNLNVPVASKPLVNILENRFHNEVMPLVLEFPEHLLIHEIDLIKVQLFRLDTDRREGIIEIFKTEGQDLLVIQEFDHVDTVEDRHCLLGGDILNVHSLPLVQGIFAMHVSILLGFIEQSQHLTVVSDVCFPSRRVVDHKLLELYRHLFEGVVGDFWPLWFFCQALVQRFLRRRDHTKVTRCHTEIIKFLIWQIQPISSLWLLAAAFLLETHLML